MSTQPIHLGPFDKGIFLLGGQEQVPEMFVRDMCGVAQVRYNSARLRPPILSLYNIAIISAFRQADLRYALDNSGNLYKNGTIIQAGFTAATRAVVTKGPPAFGAPSYAFLAGVPLSGALQKVSPTGGISNWGIAAPPDGMAYSFGSGATITVLDPLNATAGHTPTDCTLSADNVNYPYQVTQALALTGIIGDPAYSISFAVSSAALNPGTGFIQFFLSPSVNQGNTNSITVQFGDGSGVNYFQAVIPIAGNNPGALFDPSQAPQNVSSLDAVTQSYIQATGYNSNPNQPANQMQSEFQQAIQTTYKEAPSAGLTNNKNLGRPVFIPSPGALNSTTAGAIQVQVLPATDYVGTARGWWKCRILQAGFQKVGTIAWSGVTTCVIIFQVNTLVTAVVNELAYLTLHTGGSSLFGAYQYVVTFGNSSTGSYSNPNPTPLPTQPVSFVPVILTGIPVSSDPQVDQRILWRTMGNGGFFYQLAIIPDNTTTTYTDILGDFYGINSSAFNSSTTDILSIIPLAEVNTPPPSTLASAMYYQGTMFGCRDSANPGFLYYSAPGYAEGFAGYTALINDDDNTQGFGQWNNQPYLLSQKGLWLIVNQSTSALQPLWVMQQIAGAPGCIDPLSIVSTPWGIIYRSPYGLCLFNSNILQVSDSIFAPVLVPLLRSESIEGYAAIGTIVAADFGRGEYYFSDGSGNTFACSQDGSVRPLGVPTTALNYEWDTGELIGGYANRWCEIEHGAANDGGDFGDATAFTLQTRALCAGPKYTYKIARLFIDLETEQAETIQVQLVLKGLSGGPNFTGGGNALLSLGTFTTFAGGRSVIEIPVNQVARVCSVRITGYIVDTLEVYDVYVEADQKVEREMNKR